MMSANSVYCHILGRDVSVVSDLNGNVTNVVCPEYYRLTNGCMKKNHSVGFIGTTLGKIADKAVGTRAMYCEFADPNDSPISRLLRQ